MVRVRARRARAARGRDRRGLVRSSKSPQAAGAVAAVQMARLAGGHATSSPPSGTTRSRGRAIARLTRPRAHGPRREAPAPDPAGWVYADTAGRADDHGDRREARALARRPALLGRRSSRADAVFFVAGADGVLERARAATLPGRDDALAPARAGGPRSTPRSAPATTSSEAFAPGDLEPSPELSVWTDGAAGGPLAHGGGARRAPTRRSRCRGRSRTPTGRATRSRRATTFALGRGDSIEDALALGARCGAAASPANGPVRLTSPRLG